MHCLLWGQEGGRRHKQICGSEWEPGKMKFRNEILFLKALFCVTIEIYFEKQKYHENIRMKTYLLVFKEAKSVY